jgi:hypothetical protein
MVCEETRLFADEQVLKMPHNWQMTSSMQYAEESILRLRLDTVLL